MIFHNYVFNLEYDQIPDYKYMKKLFYGLYIKSNYDMVKNYDWLDDSKID